MLATGWDNVAFLVDGQWLVRFPRRAVAVPGVQREIAVLPRLASRLPLPIPDPQFIGQPSDSGQPDSRRSAAAVAVGHFLRILHDPCVVAAIDGADLPVDPMQRASPGLAPGPAGKARDVLDRLVHRGIWPGDSHLRQFLDQAEHAAAGTESAAPVAAATEPASVQGPLVVCHGDLHVRHLQVDRDGSATGVIDWGDRCLADPAVDLSIAYLGSPGERAPTCCPPTAGRLAPSGSWRPARPRSPWPLPSRNTQPTTGGPNSGRNASPGQSARWQPERPAR